MSPLFLDVDDAGLAHPTWCDHGSGCYVTDDGTPDVSVVHTKRLPMLTLHEWRWADGRVERVVTADWEEICDDDVDGQAAADLEVLARDARTAREWLAARQAQSSGTASCARTERATHAAAGGLGTVGDVGTVRNVGTVGAAGVVGCV
ncbi:MULTISPECIES: hypothetical protein [unclassified Actinomyces]|uniref:hypothetical protein n=1 Tax=unclassified Actinomyces TaxID=2609248 RepID=UPI002017EF0D|nr:MULTISPECIES: hypothetical protein [unclassified Actinomyces]MCL3777829.1 hypothetical protein [Actinomyces sp. AC-20-1]MCL3789669.1 hypothetical protein [Actinomyces sp. 187325]MCL3792278.1 hypothetical protein [Actinomyces sp. 186855]MCL3794970.1 hypothetical protein [Actinomyces sp. 217892]